MASYRTSYSDAMTAMIRQHGEGKNQDFFLFHEEEADGVLEEEINGMSYSELFDLMEMAGIIKAPQCSPSDPGQGDNNGLP